MDWIYLSLHWYLTFLIIGIIFFPLTKKIFGRFFPDLGYGLAKALGILLLTYASFFFGIIKIIPFSQGGLFFLLAIFAFLNFTIFRKSETQLSESKPQTFFLIVFEEILFLSALLFWAFVRGQEGSIRGLEKFMDFGFINSILRSRYFPPLDMWYSSEVGGPNNGYFINYYYFGHLSGALLIKLTGIKATIGYNLILASTFALTVIQSFSLVVGIIFQYKQKIKDLTYSSLESFKYIFYGVIGSFIVSLGGNLHTIYVFTKGYPNEDPIPFWEIMVWKYNPTSYWYPNATRFIKNTIHEFPSYSWVVADMHGHVFDIPFVLITLAFLLIFFLSLKNRFSRKPTKKKSTNIDIHLFNLKLKIESTLTPNYSLLATVFLGFLCAVHYMTNAFDGPIYLLLIGLVLFILFGVSKTFFVSLFTTIISFIIFVLPFSINFKPFVSGIGVNCSPEFLTKIGKIGPFLFEKGNCQVSPLWMLPILWGFFWISFILYGLAKKYLENKSLPERNHESIDTFMLILFSFGTFLIIIPEFFYIKDIYPEHFRANTMFKLGYQAFIMMGIASAIAFFKIKLLPTNLNRALSIIFVFFFILIAIYPIHAVPSYYGQLDKPVELDGDKWFDDAISSDGLIPEDIEIIDYLNSKVIGQPTVLEAQGDSYTDYQRISAYTGLPTVSGWWVHEWLWRGNSDVVGKRIPDITNIYESDDLNLTKKLLRKYKVSYVVISDIERKKYPNLKKDKFDKIGDLIFTTSKKGGALYQVNL